MGETALCFPQTHFLLLLRPPLQALRPARPLAPTPRCMLSVTWPANRAIPAARRAVHLVFARRTRDPRPAPLARRTSTTMTAKSKGGWSGASAHGPQMLTIKDASALWGGAKEEKIASEPGRRKSR